MDGLYWAVGIIIAAFGAIASYIAIVDYLKKLTANDDAQPKLAFSLVHYESNYQATSKKMHHTFDIGEGEALSNEQRKKVYMDYHIKWEFTIDITNQTHDTAYRVRVIQLPEDSPVKLNNYPGIDRTKPFLHAESKTFSFNFYGNCRCTAKEISAKLKGIPVEKIRIEYFNAGDKLCATDFILTEGNLDNVNVYYKLG